MRTIPAREIKRRGISAVDEVLLDGPVYIIAHDQPRYVILDVDHYDELVEAYEEISVARVKTALAEARAGDVRRSTAQEIIDELGLEA